MSQEPLDIIVHLYQAGQQAFEQGRYRESVQQLELARQGVEPNTRLGGEIQIWLVTAYEATGQRKEAIALCKQLVHHPAIATRKQARRLLEVLEAPKLYIDPEGFVKIPDLNELDGNEMALSQQTSTRSTQQTSKATPQPQEAVDLSSVNHQDNRFIGVALSGILFLLGALLWMAQS